MFAPCPRVRLGSQGSVVVVDLRRTNVGCIPGTNQSAPTEVVGRIRSWAWRKTGSSMTCSLGPAGIAQQTLDLQATVQTGSRCMARTESSNLTAYTPAADHPLTVDDLLASVLIVSRLGMRRVDSG